MIVLLRAKGVVLFAVGLVAFAACERSTPPEPTRASTALIGTGGSGPGGSTTSGGSTSGGSTAGGEAGSRKRVIIETVLPCDSPDIPAGEPCAVVSDCSGAWNTVSSLTDVAAWLSSPLPACVDGPSHSPPQLYDNCTSTSIASCGLPNRGAVYCVNLPSTGDGGRLMLTCLAQADCPSGWRCVWPEYIGSSEPPPPQEQGVCEKTCTGDKPGECGRCDLQCYREYGFCYDLVPPPRKPCVSSCECPSQYCEQGWCLEQTGNLPPMGDFCGDSPGACACKGGNCRASDRCCVLPGGSIANWRSPECQP